MTVLVVEDDADLREIISEQFLAKKYIVYEASNGLQALKILEENHVDLILTDVQMPVMDGMDFLKSLNEKYRNHAPVFIMTGGNKYSESQFYQAGAIALFDKPVDISKIIFYTEKVS